MKGKTVGSDDKCNYEWLHFPRILRVFSYKFDKKIPVLEDNF